MLHSNDNMLISVDGRKSHICIVMPRATTKNLYKAIHSNTLPLSWKSEWNPKKCSNNLQQDKKKENEEQEIEETKTKQIIKITNTPIENAEFVRVDKNIKAQNRKLSFKKRGGGALNGGIIKGLKKKKPRSNPI